MPVALNNAQLEILKLFRNDQPEEELQEIKSLLIAYLGNKVTQEADNTFAERGYGAAIFEKWKHEHFRNLSDLN
jgi:hypothetical protein